MPPKTRAHELCGRMWRLFNSSGGNPILGVLSRSPERVAATGVIQHWLNRSRRELHPDAVFPKDVQTGYLGTERLVQLGIA